MAPLGGRRHGEGSGVFLTTSGGERERRRYRRSEGARFGAPAPGVRRVFTRSLRREAATEGRGRSTSRAAPVAAPVPLGARLQPSGLGGYFLEMGTRVADSFGDGMRISRMPFL
jgi:hypothetical protein